MSVFFFHDKNGKFMITYPMCLSRSLIVSVLDICSSESGMAGVTAGVGVIFATVNNKKKQSMTYCYFSIKLI